MIVFINKTLNDLPFIITYSLAKRFHFIEIFVTVKNLGILESFSNIEEDKVKNELRAYCCLNIGKLDLAESSRHWECWVSKTVTL